MLNKTFLNASCGIFAWFMQKQFSELLMKAASDYGALTASVADFQWSQTFKEPPSVWGVSLYINFIRFYSSRMHKA